MVLDIPVSGEFRKLFSTLSATCKIPNPSQSPNEPPTCMNFMVWFPFTLIIDKGWFLPIFKNPKGKRLAGDHCSATERVVPWNWQSKKAAVGWATFSFLDYWKWRKSKERHIDKNVYIREEGSEGRLHKFCRSHLQKWNWHQNTIKYNKES